MSRRLLISAVLGAAFAMAYAGLSPSLEIPFWGDVALLSLGYLLISWIYLRFLGPSQRNTCLVQMTGCVAIFFLFAGGLALFGLLYNPTIVIGPTPEDLEEHCQPVLAWITSETARLGEAPPNLSPEMAEHMGELPYPWNYSRIRIEGKPKSCVLYVGSPDNGWPPPLYSYEWSSGRGWSWWADYSVTNEEAKRILEEHGYYGAGAEAPPR